MLEASTSNAAGSAAPELHGESSVPPFEKGGPGGISGALKIPLNPPFSKGDGRGQRTAWALLALSLIVFLPATQASASDPACSGRNYPSTFALIQDVVFERHSCTDQL